MAKNKQKRRRKGRKKSNLLPLLAIGIGVYLLIRDKKVVNTLPLEPTLPTLPGSAPVIQGGESRRLTKYL